jgi:HK97 gp10 family phage protein
MTDSFSVKIEGLDKVRDRLKGLGPTISKKVLGKAVSSGARMVRDGAKALVPVDTGVLRNSLYSARIRELSSPEQVTYFVGSRKGKRYKVKDSDGWYFHLVEFGTVKMPAKPFLRPAFELYKYSAEEEIRRQLLRGVEKYGNYVIG